MFCSDWAVQADLNRRFKTFDLSRGCCTSSPFSFSGVTPVVSLRLALSRLHSFSLPWSTVGFTLKVLFVRMPDTVSCFTF